MKGEHVVIDAAALLDLMVATDVGPVLDVRLQQCVLHAPGHLDAEVLAGLAALERAGVLSAGQTLSRLQALAVAPIERHPVRTLLEGAWRRRGELAIGHALCVELARSLGVTLITTDPSVAPAANPIVELVRSSRTAG